MRHAHDILVSIECCRMLYIPQRLCFCVINACSMKPSWTTKNFHPAWCYLSCTTLYMVVHSKDVEVFQLTLGWSATFDSLAVDLWDDSTLVQAFCWMKVFASFIGLYTLYKALAKILWWTLPGQTVMEEPLKSQQGRGRCRGSLSGRRTV